MEKGLQIKGAVSQGIQETSRSWKRQENELSSLQEGRQLCWHINFNPMKHTSDFWLPQL